MVTDAVVGEGLCNHEADARASAGDDAGPALDVEEVLREEGLVVGGHGVGGEGAGWTGSDGFKEGARDGAEHCR